MQAAQTTIDDAEIAKFEAMAAEWWDPNGKFKPLHMLNPCRLDYITGQIAAEFERDLINARCDEGRKAAKAKGVQFGRKPKMTDEQLDSLKADVKAGILSMQAIADKYQIARNSVYRLAGAKEAA